MPQHITVLQKEDGEFDTTPTYLFDHAELYRENPHDAAVTWFAEAHYGLGIHFGLHSLLGRGHDIVRRGGIKIDEYRKLLEAFKAEHFDAVDLVEFAIANGMRYIDFTVRGEDGFCLYNSSVCKFNCAESSAKRDLLAELASVCEYHGVGLCLSYCHGADLSHANSPGTPEAKAEAVEEYLDYAKSQLSELLTQYGPIAAICLEGMEHLGKNGYDEAACSDLYKMIRHIQPQALIAYQQGVTGEEDFFFMTDDAASRDMHADKIAQKRELLAPGCLSYSAEMAGRHLREEYVTSKLREAYGNQANLLVGTCLMPDGSLDLEDINTLLAVGQYIEKNGFPR